jgi:DNA end-binding protein Ku
MAARSINTATISFGLVTVPVRVYPATRPSARIGFHLLHAEDHARLQQQYICTKDGEVVPRDEMVKGYEYQKGRYVVFSKEELKALEQKATHGIEIAEFVPARRVNPVFFESAYYLGPDKGGEKPYALLAAAMQELDYAALATYAARGKSYLVLLRPADGHLVMHQLYHAEEVRAASEVPVEARKTSPAEMKLARQLMEQIASDRFDPGQYDDEVRRRTLDVIERKVQGEPIEAPPAERPAKVVDLMEALKASLARKEPTGMRRAPQRAAARRSHAGRSGHGRGGRSKRAS